MTMIKTDFENKIIHVKCDCCQREFVLSITKGLNQEKHFCDSCWHKYNRDKKKMDLILKKTAKEKEKDLIIQYLRRKKFKMNSCLPTPTKKEENEYLRNGA